jgi:nucleoside-diphosphate-sugar epimerase
MQQTALVLGVTGGIGGEVARLLLTRGWQVKALHRHPAQAQRQGDGVDWLAGDAMVAEDVLRAAQGVQLIVHAVNPPGYRKWASLVLPMIDNTIAAARASGARILLPGTVYNYGQDVFPHIGEDAPQRPLTRKGAIRVEMERRLRDSGLKVLVVRAGDFFGPQAGNSWFAQGLVKPGKPVTVVSNPATPGIGHQWAYLPDVAETMVRLLEQGAAAEGFASYHLDGHWDADGEQMAAAVARVTGARVRPFPWWLVTLASPLVTVFRELREMRYLWRQPVRLSNARLLAVLGNEPHTPLDVAVRLTLQGLGSLPEQNQVSASPAKAAMLSAPVAAATGASRRGK